MDNYNNEYTGSKNRKYTNGEITVYWYPRKCIHATTCFRELIEVFNPRKRPWVNMNGASTKEIIRVVDLCPTGALAYKYNDQITDNDTPSALNGHETEIRVMEDGPLIIRGSFKLTGTDGKEYNNPKMVSLCRCGASMNKPFCDGTHSKTGYKGK
ncbi:MAG: (4Fe-4S)-binding protein [Bacteroidales bacterium]|nr:(4Fe-4S)-binding protein [Bacteroidales bacterium]